MPPNGHAPTVALPADRHFLSNQVQLELEGKSAPERMRLARALEARFEGGELSSCELRAAEELARRLAHDAIEMVRQELAKAVKNYRFLPRDIALRISHDIDLVARPFLQATEVFREEDWQQLVLTVSSGARVAIAGREDLSESLVSSLAQIGEAEVVEALVSNRKAPLTPPACFSVVERFPDHPTLLERMVARNELAPEIVVQLISKVSEAVRENLARSYDMEDFTGPAAAEAETASLLRVVRNTPRGELRSLAETLNGRAKLGPFFLLRALDEGLLAFFEAGLAVRARITIDDLRRLVCFGGEIAVMKLCDKAGIPCALKDDFALAIRDAFPAPGEQPQAVAQSS